MESDFKAIHMKKNLDNMIHSVFPVNEFEIVSGDDEAQQNKDYSDDDEWESIMQDEIKKLYDSLDHDKSGYIDRTEVEKLLQELGRNVSVEEMNEGFQRLDMDGSGFIDYNEFDMAWPPG